MVRSAFIALVTLLATAPAAAQDAKDDRATARALFEEGVELAGADRWAEAVTAFRGSAALVPRASTSYNIANALYRLDRPVEGLAELDDYDRMPEVLADRAAAERGAALRELLEAAVIKVRLFVTPADAGAFLDGRALLVVGAERRLSLNPGTHTLRLIRDGYASQQREIQAARGSALELTIALEPAEAAAPLPVAVGGPSGTIGVGAREIDLSASESSRDDPKPFVKRPGFWVMIGAIAAAGIATGVAIAVTRRNDAPSCGTTGSCATTLGLSVASF